MAHVSGNAVVPSNNASIAMDPTRVENFESAIDNVALQVAGAAPFAQRTVTVTTSSFTLQAADFQNSVVRFTYAGTVSITIPLNQSVAAQVGMGCELRACGATTVLSLAGQTGVTVVPNSTLLTSSQWQSIYLTQDQANQWLALANTVSGSGGGGGLLSFVRQATPIHDGSATTTRALTIVAPANGNALIIPVVSYGNPVTGMTATGLTFVQAPSGQGAPHHDRGTDGSYVSVWYALNAASAGTTVTITSSSASVAAMGVEVSGLGSTVTPNFYWNDTNGANTTNPNPGPVTGGGKIAVWVMADSNGDLPLAYPSGYTSLTPPGTAMAGAYQLSPTSGTPTGTSNSEQWNCAVLTLA